MLVAALSAAAADQPRISPRLGGAASRAALGADAFALPPADLPAALLERFFAGQRIFNATFIKSPSPAPEFTGLGPTFNRPSCGACHERNGRGMPPRGPDDALMQMVVRLGVPTRQRDPIGLPHPVYGDQLNDRAIEGVPAEGRAAITWTESAGRYGDGEIYRLRRAELRFHDLAFSGLSPAMASLRIAPQLVGLGLLEIVPAEDMLAWAKANSARDDGVRGTPRSIDGDGNAPPRLGRFGWRALQPTLRDQIAAALIGDMGLTTTLHPVKNCPPAQSACRAADPGPRPNVSAAQLDMLTFYIGALAVPERRNADDRTVRHGERLFFDLGCAACHRDTLRTAAHPTLPFLSWQTIHPFTDLLLHDMGDGLADQVLEGKTSGRLWRTAPLWGIGLVRQVNGHENFLHDGRARGLAEAILWHGGEAENARERFRTSAKADRDALLAFLRSL